MSEEKNLYEEIDVESITLEMEDGSMQEFAILVTFDVEDKQYAALAPIEGDTIGEDTFFVACEEDGEEVIISSIDSEDEAKTVEAAFDALFEEEE